MEEGSKECKHLERIINNLNQHWSSIQLLLSHVSKPLLVDDRGLRQVIQDINTNLRSTVEQIKELDLTRINGELKFIGKKLHEIEQTLGMIKKEGIPRDIRVKISVDGQEDDKETEPANPLLDLLMTLTERERKIVIYRMGLFGEKKKTWDAIGKIFGVTREPVRQNFSKALRKLRHPTRKDLRDKVDLDILTAIGI